MTDLLKSLKIVTDKIIEFLENINDEQSLRKNLPMIGISWSAWNMYSLPKKEFISC